MCEFHVKSVVIQINFAANLWDLRDTKMKKKIRNKYDYTMLQIDIAFKIR
jgi:hypothetical protein